MKIYRRLDGVKVPILSRIRLRQSEDIEMKAILEFFNNFDYENCKFKDFSTQCRNVALVVKKLYLDDLFDFSPSAFLLRDVANYVSFSIPQINEAYLNFKIKHFNTDGPTSGGSFKSPTGSVNNLFNSYVFLFNF